MAKKRKRKASAEDKVGIYRCPICEHRWKQCYTLNADCPECGEIQGPVSVHHPVDWSELIASCRGRI